MMNEERSHQLTRTLTIRAPRELVFRYFTDSARWASWWGAGSTIDARVGGRVLIRFPGGNEVIGEVLELRPPEKIVFTYGYAAGTPIAPNGSTATIRLEAVAAGTRLHLTHGFDEERPMQDHVQGWRYQLSLFGNIVANEQHADAAATVDRWFAMWSDPNAETRHRELDRLASANLSMQDRFSAVDGIDDVRAHLDAVHRFMPGFTLRREGDAQQCQGQVLVQWRGVGADGQQRGSGRNVFRLGADGRIESVTGFWDA
jgi:uncharacterized protein YndB with AHSA1/START domain